jgi:hypothetical protein
MTAFLSQTEIQAEALLACSALPLIRTKIELHEALVGGPSSGCNGIHLFLTCYLLFLDR